MVLRRFSLKKKKDGYFFAMRPRWMSRNIPFSSGGIRAGRSASGMILEWPRRLELALWDRNQTDKAFLHIQQARVGFRHAHEFKLSMNVTRGFFHGLSKRNYNLSWRAIVIDRKFCATFALDHLTVDLYKYRTQLVFMA